MRLRVALVLVAGTVTLAEVVAYRLGVEAWLVIPLTLVAAAAGAVAFEGGRQAERRRQRRRRRVAADAEQFFEKLFAERWSN